LRKAWSRQFSFRRPPASLAPALLYCYPTHSLRNPSPAEIFDCHATLAPHSFFLHAVERHSHPTPPPSRWPMGQVQPNRPRGEQRLGGGANDMGRALGLLLFFAMLFLALFYVQRPGVLELEGIVGCFPVTSSHHLAPCAANPFMDEEIYYPTRGNSTHRHLHPSPCTSDGRAPLMSLSPLPPSQGRKRGERRGRGMRISGSLTSMVKVPVSSSKMVAAMLHSVHIECEEK